MKEIYLVEIIRFGNPDLGVHTFGVFDDVERIAPAMTAYNVYRGGKYPAYYVTNMGVMNPNDSDFCPRAFYEVDEPL